MLTRTTVKINLSEVDLRHDRKLDPKRRPPSLGAVQLLIAILFR